MQNLTAPINEERFWAKVNKTETCWQWTAAILNGYGRFGVYRDGKLRSGLAHRVSYELSGRDIPAGLFLDHMCHNRACVNPKHLRVVNNKQNLENHSGPTVANTSGVRGVSLHKPSMLWRAICQSDGKRYNAGYFKTIPEAEAAVIALRNRLHTHNDVDRVA
jgi:hypothetical protein